MEENKVFYLDTTPCDELFNFKDAERIPKFALEDKSLDTDPPHTAVLVATSFGYAIVVKWLNNGSTRIYGLSKDVVSEAYYILNRITGNSVEAAYGDNTIHTTFYKDDDDRKLFYGYDPFDVMHYDTATIKVTVDPNQYDNVRYVLSRTKGVEKIK